VAANDVGTYDLMVDETLRTQVEVFNLTALDASDNTICWVSEEVAGEIVLGSPESCSRAQALNGVNVAGPLTIRNPTIVMADPPSSTIVATAAVLEPLLHEPDVFILQHLEGQCTPRHNVAFLQHETLMFRHDARVHLQHNTIEAPATRISDAGPLMWDTCPTAPKTFVNKHTCVRRPDCTSLQYSTANITLNEAGIRSFFAHGGKLVFMVAGLDLHDFYSTTSSPCSMNWHSQTYSRWISSDGACEQETELNADTRASIAAELRKNTDCYMRHPAAGYGGNEVCKTSTNELIRDINVKGTCTDSAAKGASITVDGICWTHVHDDEYGVYDMTSYAAGAVEAIVAAIDFEPHPFDSLAASGATVYDFASLHLPNGWEGTRLWSTMKRIRGTQYADNPMDESYLTQMTALGRFGDVIDFASLPEHLQTAELAVLLGATGTAVYDGTEACGSPGEVASDPMLRNQFPLYAGFRFEQSTYPQIVNFKDMTSRISARNTKSAVWFDVVVNAPDQLRQRAAWSLSQIFALGIIDENTMDMALEHWTVFYDIFTRNALGNFRTLFKEIAYSPLMGAWLTFRGSQAFAVSGNYPDENFA
jgi:cullin-associated NEDD8-dissociated protein 1